MELSACRIRVVDQWFVCRADLDCHSTVPADPRPFRHRGRAVPQATQSGKSKLRLGPVRCIPLGMFYNGLLGEALELCLDLAAEFLDG